MNLCPRQMVMEFMPMTVKKSVHLTRWIKQGVFLLNTCLTVRQHREFSHSGKGWETFTDTAIAALNRGRLILCEVVHSRISFACLTMTRLLTFLFIYPVYYCSARSMLAKNSSRLSAWGLLSWRQGALHTSAPLPSGSRR